ncbi:MAG: alpha-L-fucosidase, partial [Candidatus Latescibacteria bacterium]|nr:alpha-L-fucosidase [Candidatus Latescibacterota bacterium]
EIKKGGHGGLAYKGDEPASFRVWSIELARPEAMEAIQQRATAMREDGEWMIEKTYGLFVHWSTLSSNIDGTQRPYEEAVNLFDVEAFADMVEQTGAAWLILTTTHGKHNFAAPIQAIDQVLPGYTTRRDLIMEIADALEKRSIRLMLYYHIGLDNNAWPEAVGYYDADKSRWFENIITIHREIAERYGEKTWGWFFDDGHKWYYPCDFPWERYYESIKTGNAKRLVAFNPGTRPSVTPFGDLLASDNGSNLRPPMSKRYFDEQGDYAGLLQHFSFTLEPAWTLKQQQQIRDPGFPKPVHDTEELIGYVRTCQAARVPVTMNILITQDVTREKPFVNKETLEQMGQVRRAIRSI